MPSPPKQRQPHVNGVERELEHTPAWELETILGHAVGLFS